MTKKTQYTLQLTQLALAVLLFSACGPKCPETKLALDEETATSEDVARVNAFVKKRKEAIKEAETGPSDTFRLRRLKFSVTAYEQAIETQARIIKISPNFDNSPKYKKHRDIISEIRCFYDQVAEDLDYVVSDGDGKQIRQYHDLISNILRKDGELMKPELQDYIDQGIGSK